MLAEDARVSELVMVIEDEKDIRDLVRYNLEKAGYRVAASADGEEASCARSPPRTICPCSC